MELAADPKEHVSVVFLEACPVVHQVDHADRLVVSQVLEEPVGEVLPDILFEVDLSLLPELHDAYPDHGLGGRTPVYYRVLVDFDALGDIGIAIVSFIDRTVPVEHADHHAGCRILVILIEGVDYLLMSAFVCLLILFLLLRCRRT